MVTNETNKKINCKFFSTCHATAYCDMFGNETRIASSTGYCGLAGADVPYTTFVKYHSMNSKKSGIVPVIF